MYKAVDRKEIRDNKHRRVRNRISGTVQRPRLCVYRSLNHIYAQLINDDSGTTMVAASTLDEALKKELSTGGDVAAAKMVGRLIAEKALAKGIKAVVFDRGGNIYHGRIAALADGAREAGLEF